MVVALSYLIAIIITILLAIFLYPIAALFWCLGLFGKVSEVLFSFTKQVISALWRDIRNMNKTAPIPATSPEDLWHCSCGCANEGKFCKECGAPKPQPASNTENADAWVCECGASNTAGKFCAVCGRPNPSNIIVAEAKMLEE